MLPVRLPGALAEVRDLTIWKERALVVAGANRSGGHLVALVDAATGFLDLRHSDAPPRITGDGRYVSVTQAPATIALDLADPRFFEKGDGVAGQVRLLRTGALDDKWRVLGLLEHHDGLSRDPRMQEALVAEVARVMEEDRTALRGPGSGSGQTPEHTAREEYRDSLLVRATATRDPRVIPFLVQAELAARRPGLLAAFREEAIPAILDALRRPTPRGHPRGYRAGLMQALIQIAGESVGKLTPRSEHELRSIVRDSFARSDRGILREAILLAELFDDASLVAQIERFTNRDELRARGIEDAAAVGAIQDAAREVLSRRVVIR